MNYISNINSANKSLEFIDKRLQSENYRGIHLSQHNRYDLNKVISILKLLKNHIPSSGLMQIRTTDTSKRSYNLDEEKEYALFFHNAKSLTGIGTQDSMRKNLFVDFARMGFIHRFNAQKQLTNPFSKENIKFVCLSNMGLRLINEESNIINRNLIFSKGLNNLLGGFLEDVLNLLTNSDLKYITFDEFMLFVSAINCEFEFGINLQECKYLIKQYRLLSRLNKKSVIETLKTKLVPSNFQGNKKDKRDFHNWSNETQQVWSLLENVPFFIVEKDSNKLTLVSNDTDLSKYNTSKMKRSQQAKKEYFKNHNVAKTKGYELDHIIPLLEAESIQEYQILDHWLNLLYIDGKTHAIKSQSNSRYHIFSFDESCDTVYLADTQGDRLTIVHDEHGLFDKQKVTQIHQYNQEFINSH